MLPQRLSLPRKLGSRFFAFWLKVLVSPLYLWQNLINISLVQKIFSRRRRGSPPTAPYRITSRHRKPPASAPGFILPTVTMVLLVFSLVVSSILLRTSQQTQQVAGARENQATYNTATPAIERAKSKIEFLFKRDYRFPNQVPPETDLQNLVLNVSTATYPQPYKDASGNYVDVYTLPGETRLDINGDNKVDNAWAFTTDIDGDGTTETIAYSLLMRQDNATQGWPPTAPTVTLESSDQNKASSLVTRTGPLSVQSAASSSQCSSTFRGTVEAGWNPINTATVRKNFQVNAVVVNRKNANRSVTSIEFQQDRQMDRGNKWGVWFRYDLEAFPGPQFNWNGAMHTDGNLIWGDTSAGESIRAYLISSPNSCLYTQDESELTMTQVEDINGQVSFQGQVINGTINNGSFVASSPVHVFPGAGKAPTSFSNLTLATDSVKDSLQTSSRSPADFSLDPIALFTEDQSVSRYSTDPTNVALRDANWTTRDLSQRLINKMIRRPYVDDTYRADDRWGPKPVYNSEISVPSASQFGQDINDFVDTLTKEDATVGATDDVGLDGYWERRARVEGLRLIVGQRLDLGDTYGWRGNNDPLYPPNSTTLTNVERQRRTLRDNPSAVQSTLVYHYENNLDFPIATIASTVHNGTATLRDQSRTFTNLSDIGKVNTDFLNGIGTNGWEFNAPGNVTNQTDFIALIDQSNDPLRIALNNLAHLAGDPQGAFPAQQETSGTKIHPYPNLAMWGDFSNLRRALDKMSAGTAYSDLSLADRTTIQTAAATIGMLAYNLDNAKRVYEAASDNGPAGLTALGEHLWQLVDGNTSNGEVNTQLNNPVPFPAGYNRATDAASFYGQFTADQYIEALQNDNSLGSAANKAQLIERARQVMILETIERDRILGFVTNRFVPAVVGSTSGWNSTTGNISIRDGSQDIVFKTSCDPDTFNDSIGGGNGSGNGLLQKKLGLSLAFCSATMPAKYPALYYLFPKQNHDHRGNNFDANNTAVINANDDQPLTEEYVADLTIFDPAASTDINHGFIYRVIQDTSANGIEDGSENGIRSLVLNPRFRTGSTAPLWRLPSAAPTTPTAAQTNVGNSIVDNGTTAYVPFLDKAIYNGRQLMQERVLDIDLDMLRSQRVNPGISTSDTWMSASGVIYAFREDALREDGIQRPSPRAFGSCDTETELLSANCRMVTTAGAPQDPPTSNTTGVSTKPVDYFPDPGRRSYGFRLKNGADISRYSPFTDSNRSPYLPYSGFSFVSDNPIYVQGNLNLHQNSSGTRLEEFTTLLSDDWSNFYSRGSGGTNGSLDANFARPSVDRWRPVEILGDALTLLSDNFCDGVMEDGFRDTNTNCPTGRTSSYRDSVLANTGQTLWWRENGLFNDLQTASIRIDRNGQLFRKSGSALTTTVDYSASSWSSPYTALPSGTSRFTDYIGSSGTGAGAGVNGSGRDLNTPIETRMNAIFINGLVPSRNLQSYGGLHNFPRFIENWSGVNLFLSGAFVQLNFSTYATAPFDQESWEPSGSAPTTTENIPYYGAPGRRWGYDIGLQYNPAGPIASRFISVGSPRNEFYEEIPGDDPYAKQLRCSRLSGQRIDTNATDCT